MKVEQGGSYDLTAMVSSGSDQSSFLLSMDGTPLLDTIMVPNGESWDIYVEMKAGTVNLTEGEHRLRLTITGSYVNVDWLKFSVPGEETGLFSKPYRDVIFVYNYFALTFCYFFVNWITVRDC